MTNAALKQQLDYARYPRASRYDPDWVLENQMGPNALWLLESLAEILAIKPGMKVLDLGCGRAMTSIFLTKEFGAEVWATDLWIQAGDNLKRVREAGVEDLVHPVHAEAHALPYEKGFFDAVISVDAYQYFGTDDLYIGTITEFLREDGKIGIVVPALFEEFGADVPDSLAPYWEWDFCCWHGPDWWRTHWEKSGKVTVEHADAIPDGWKDWLRWEQGVGPFMEGWMKESCERGVAMLKGDQGKLLGFTRVVGSKL